MIEITNLTKRFGDKVAVDNITFNVNEGEIMGFLGPNGAGKSTTLNILTGYLSATSGSAKIDGIDVLEDPIGAKRRIGFLPEIPPLYLEMTVKEYLDFAYELKGCRLPRKQHIKEICEVVKITDVYNRKIKNLSKGYRQRVGFAQALIGNPDVLILDEPTVGLDPKQIIEIRNLIARLGKNHTIILSSHILSEIQAVCKRVIIINKGQIIADDTPENLSNKLSSDHSLIARIVAGEQEMIDALSTVKGVKSVTSLGRKEDGSFDFLIEPEHGADVRAEVFKRIVSRGKTLLSLTSNKVSLEQIFLRLTEAADNDEAKRMLGITEKTETAEKPSVEIADDGSVTVKTEQAEEAEQ